MKIIQGAVAGLLAAVVVDYHAFQQWKSLDDLTKYDWKTAGLRWAQGAITGAVTVGAVGLV